MRLYINYYLTWVAVVDELSVAHYTGENESKNLSLFCLIILTTEVLELNGSRLNTVTSQTINSASCYLIINLLQPKICEKDTKQEV